MFEKVNRRIVAFATALVMVSSCFLGVLGDTTNSQAAKKAKLKAKSITLEVGKKKTIQITGKNSKAKYTYKASNKKIKVSKKGVITAVKAGSAKVTVKETLKKKTRSLGTVKVTVKAQAAKQTEAPAATTPASTATTAPAATASATPAAGQPTTQPDVPTPAEPTTEPTKEPESKPTVEPAYQLQTIDFDGSSSKVVESEITIPLEKAMLYGGICKVTADFTQETGSDQEITVGYEGEYLAYEKNGAYITKKWIEQMSDSSSFTCPSGQKTTQEFSFEVPKYSNDFNLKLSAAGGFTVDNLKVEAMPFADADYAGMVANSTLSTGNNARIKKAIEKARAGEDVTIAYLGGSITEGFAASETNNDDCYAKVSYSQFKQMFGAGDGDNVHFINAGMSGTPSSLGVVRYQRDVLEQMEVGEYPDILFIDFAVNDGNDADTYESVIRNALDQGSAVVLMFVLYTGGCAKEGTYSKIGEYYDLAMVSPAQGMASSDKKAFDEWFYWIEGRSYGHPDVGGHRYMADCISNMFKTIDAEETETDNITSVAEITPKEKDGSKFVGMKTLVSSTDISNVDAVKELDAGGFSEVKDNNQSTLQYIKNGQEKMQWFPDVWARTASTSTESFTMTISCRSLIIAYKQASGSSFGKADCYIDGVKVGSLSQSTGGWNNASLFRALKEDEVKEHEVEIRMQDGDETKPFTIFAIGYCD